MGGKLTRLFWAPMLALFAMIGAEYRRVKNDTAAQFNIGTVGAIFSTIIGAIVVLAVLGATIGDYITNANTVATEVGNTTAWTDATIGAIASPMGLFVGVGLLFGVAGLILAAVRLRD